MDQSAYHWLYRIERGYGVVPLFAAGLASVLANPPAQIIACLHDDVWIEEDAWDEKVLSFFADHPSCGLLGFGGATGLGASNIYQVPYDPMQLARQDFVSNMRNAEAHGRRAQSQSDWRMPYRPERVACLDGFSLIGRREFWLGGECLLFKEVALHGTPHPEQPNLFQQMAGAGLIHHAYDAALGCYAARLGWEVWMLPLRVHHHGGLTAVANRDYHAWAKTQDPEGDQGFWNRAHRWVYEEFRIQLPIRVQGGGRG